jgi:hypothetical protein
MHPTKFRFIWQSVEILLILSQSINKPGHHRQFLFLIGRFLKIFYSETTWPNGPKPGLWKVLYGKDWDKMSSISTELSIDASYQVSVHSSKAVSEDMNFRNRPIRNKNCLWQPYLLMDAILVS